MFNVWIHVQTSAHSQMLSECLLGICYVVSVHYQQDRIHCYDAVGAQFRHMH
jgi:hypothetical protein